MTDDDRAFVEDCRRFAADVLAPNTRRWDEANAFPVEAHDEARRRGIAYAGLPRELGGRGVSHEGLVRGGLEMARVCAPATFTLAFPHGSLRPLLVAGTTAQRDRWVRDLVADGGHASWCMTEPDRAGSNLLSIGARAVRVDGGFRIDGHKVMVGMGTVARVFFVLTEAWDGDRRLGPTIFAVPRGPGVHVGENPPKIGFRCLPTPDVRFEGVVVPPDAVVGGVGGGVPVLLDSLDTMRLGGGVVILGLVKGALDDARPWLHEREIYGGQRLSDASHVQILLGRLLGRLEAAEALLIAVARDLDAGRRVGRQLAALKLVASDLAIEATSEVAQLWGWRGVREDHSATRRLRDARQTSIYEGTNEVLAMNLFRAWSDA
jgi:alkylation response protein AidB-like acyl-CoA dehydrogenase